MIHDRSKNRLTNLRYAIHNARWDRVWILADPTDTTDETIVWDYLEAHMGLDWCVARLDFPHVQRNKIPNKTLLNTFISAQHRDLRGASLHSAKLECVDFPNTDLSRANFKHAELRHVTFSSSNLSHTDFTKAHFSWTTFFRTTLLHTNLHKTMLFDTTHRETTLSHADFSEACIVSIKCIHCPPIHADFTHAEIGDSSFVHADLTTSILRHATTPKSDFTDANLSRVDLYGANLSYTNLSGTNLSTTDLTHTLLLRSVSNKNTQWPKGHDPKDFGFLPHDAPENSSVTLQNKDLSRVRCSLYFRNTLQKINTIHSKLDGIDLKMMDVSNTFHRDTTFTHTAWYRNTCNTVHFERCDFSFAHLDWTTFSNTHIKDCIFNRTTLIDVDFGNTLLENCDFSHASLCGVNLYNARLHHIRLNHAVWDDATMWPEGFDPLKDSSNT